MAAGLVLLASSAAAQVVTPIPSVSTPSQAPETFSQAVQRAPSATTPLNQGDIFPLIQGGALKQIPAQSLANGGLFPIQNPHALLIGPLSGAQAAPTFRSLALSDLPSIANNTVLGNVGGAEGAPSALSPSALTGLCDLFSASLSGCVPASGGGTTTFLRADGSFATPPGTGITQLTGSVTAGPGTGATVATIAPTGVRAGEYAISSQSGSGFCLSINDAGQVTGISVGSCGEGIALALEAAPGEALAATPTQGLLAEAGALCGPLQTDFSNSCNGFAETEFGL